MPFSIVRNDITKMKTDAIVNAANSTLRGGGGVDGAIHCAAGEKLLQECITLGGCNTGEAKATKGYNLPAKYVIHTVGPVWVDGNSGEEEKLVSCYKNSLKKAVELKCKSVAFPLISSGIYGYPKHLALKIAVDTIGDFLIANDDITVYLVVFDKASFAISEQLYNSVQSFINDRYTSFFEKNQHSRLISANTPLAPTCAAKKSAEQSADFFAPCKESAFDPDDLKERLKTLDESFSQMLLRKIDEKNMTDAQCYKKANINRKLFSKIRKDVHYKPSKQTAIAFAIALELDLGDTKDLLMKAGFALSDSNKFDIIIEYFIQHKNYNIFEINQTLFAFDQCLLGA